MDHTEERIGHYRVVARIGRGGMGDVFEAEDETLQRRVALKSIRAEHRPSPRDKIRFLREARILSQLDHPGICRIYDYLDGEDRDHLVLELIKGKALGQLDLNLESRLHIIEQLLKVLVVAHEADIVHRDLKPDNVMVTAEGVVKVLDFGLARQLMQPNAHEATVTLDGDSLPDNETLDATFAQEAGILGTPSFMSPEQAWGKPATAYSDMYSCGLMMQLMLTGKSAYAPSRHLPELLQRVRDAETLQLIGVDPDLVDLVQRLTRRTAEARPTAAEALAKIRWIRGKPARRNRRLLAVLVLIIVVGSSLKYTLDLRHERHEAQAHRAQAEDLMGFMLGDLRTKLEPIGSLDVMDVVGSKAMEYFSGRNPAELSDRDADRYVRTLNLLGEIRMSQGQADSARASFAKALVTAKDLVRRDRKNAEAQIQLGATHFWLGNVAFGEGDLAEAEHHFEQYHEISRVLVERDENNPTWQLELAYAQNNLAFLYQEKGDLAEAMVILRQSIATKQWLVQKDPTNTKRVFELVNSQASYGDILADAGLLRDAFQNISQARQDMAVAVATDSLNTGYKSLYSTLLQREGLLLEYLGREEEALQLYEQDLRISRWLVRRDPTHAGWTEDLTTSLTTMASMLVEFGKIDRAERMLDEGEVLLASLTDSYSKQNAHRHLRESRAKAALARGQYEQVLAWTARTPSSASSSPTLKLFRGQALDNLARPGEAGVAWQKGLDELATLAPTTVSAGNKDLWARMQYLSGRPDEARRLLADLEQAGYRRRGFVEFFRQNQLTTE
ncbi:MAG: serine/threonine-protein kinase [Candidatus Krumholzibacteria bacterium]|nr:serine/threonine-protein kinase [Candidatus Krumholzibacteria bacterium]